MMTAGSEHLAPNRLFLRFRVNQYLRNHQITFKIKHNTLSLTVPTHFKLSNTVKTNTHPIILIVH